jgi:hypothetical protein
MTETLLVICRFNENLDWLSNCKYKYLVYNKNDTPIDTIPISSQISCPNIGREEYIYLKFIVDHYSNLPDITIFSQGDPFVHSPNFLQIIANTSNFEDVQPLTNGYSPYNPGAIFTDYTNTFLILNDIPYHVGLFNKKLDYYDITTGEYLEGWRGGHHVFSHLFNDQNLDFRKKLGEVTQFPIKDTGGLEATPICFSAIFAVRKNKILSNPLDYYKFLLYQSEFFHNNYANKFMFGFAHMMEFFWLELFRYDTPQALYLKQ